MFNVGTFIHLLFDEEDYDNNKAFALENEMLSVHTIYYFRHSV